MEFKTNYPYVFVHGMFGYGPGSKLNEKMPYFGLFGGSVAKYFNRHEIEAYEAAVGPYSSAWDRACELYAQLMGTKVDYGEAHSKKYGHKRFGRTYKKPLFAGWGQPMENGQIKKVNLIGHSFGGATTRLLITLLADGCTAEMQATAPDNISPLFTGGKAQWVYSESTYVAPHNGMTLFPSMGFLETPFRQFLYGLGNATAKTPLPKFYDFKLDQFSLTAAPNEKFTGRFTFDKVKEVAQTKDNIFYDLSPEGALEVNSHIRCLPNVYYFSYTGSRSARAMFTKGYLPTRSMTTVLKLPSVFIGTYKEDVAKHIDLDTEWLENDGIINTASGIAPENEPSVNFNMIKEIKPGIWHKMGTLDMDHLTFCGTGISANELCRFYYDHAVGINNL